MLLGDVLLRKQEVVKAVIEYKEAVDLNPDYLDKKTQLFQGKKLKVAVTEGLAELERDIKGHPGDEDMKKNRRIMYYLQRRIAGSCG